MIREAATRDGGTVGWEQRLASCCTGRSAAIDLAPGALWEHATLGFCPGGVCRGWAPELTVLVHRRGDPRVG